MAVDNCQNYSSFRQCVMDASSCLGSWFPAGYSDYCNSHFYPYSYCCKKADPPTPTPTTPTTPTCSSLGGSCVNGDGSVYCTGNGGSIITGSCSSGTTCCDFSQRTAECYYDSECPGDCGKCIKPTSDPYDNYCGTESPQKGWDAICGTSNGGSSCSAPTSNRCPYGNLVWIDKVGSDGTFNWRCEGGDGICGGNAGNTAYCSSYKIPSSIGASGQCGYPVGVNECFDSRTYPTCKNGNLNIIDDGSSGDNWVDWTCSGTAGDCGGGNGATVGCSHHVAYTVNGACLNNGGWFEGQPPNPCSTGTVTWIDSNANPTDYTYDWSCNGVCGGSSPTCYSHKNTRPIFQNIAIKNTSGVSVGSELYQSNYYNHICETGFGGTTARFEVTYTDAEAGGYRGSDIDWIKLQIGSEEFTTTNYSRSGQNTTAIFDINLSQVSARDVQRIWVKAKGYNLPENGHIGTNRYFKFWDCKVAVTGSIYDSSGVDPIKCNVYPYPGFTKLITSAANFRSLSFNSSSGNKAMSVSFPSPNYSSGSNKLVWGETYTSYSFNSSDILMEVDPNFMHFRRNGTSCIGPIFELNRANVDPYVSSVGITIDFTGVVDQDPWWRVENGGVSSNIRINNRVPVTCTSNCKASTTGLVSSVSINNTGRSNDSAFSWHYKGVEAKLANTNYGYDYFYNNYFVKNGIGLMADSMSEIGTSGVYFVDDNLNINSNNAIASNKSLMIVVNGDINVSKDVTQVNGILVAKNIGATGLNNSPLVFNGSLYAENTIDLSRGFKTKRNNNLNPAVRVVYNPAMIFKLPPETSKILTNYKWGN